MPQDFMINTRAIAATLRREFGDEAVQDFFGESRSLDHFDGSQQYLDHLLGMVERAAESANDTLKAIAARAKALTQTERLTFP